MLRIKAIRATKYVKFLGPAIQTRRTAAEIKATEGGCYLSSVAIQGLEVDAPWASQGNIWVQASAEDAREKRTVSTVFVTGATPEELLEKATQRWRAKEGAVL